MCLTKVDEVLKQHKVGYKIFGKVKNPKKLKGLFFSPRFQYPKQKWFTDPNNEIIDDGVLNYEPGFHYYLTKEDASQKFNSMLLTKDIEMYRILIQKKICTGLQHNLRCGVAKEIFIKEKVEPISISQQERKKYLYIVKNLKVKEIATIAEQIYQERKKGLDVKDLYYKYKNILTKNIETYWEFVSFWDRFSRNSDRWKTITLFHSFAMDFPKYYKCYCQIVKKGRDGTLPKVKIDSISWKVNY